MAEQEKQYNWSENGIGFLRLLLASLVILGHAPLLGGFAGGYGDHIFGPYAGGFGTVAVVGFFTLSGMLITRSWESSKGFKDYFAKRFLRIYPGYWVCLLACGFIFGPIAWNHVHGGVVDYPWTGQESALSYFYKNFTSKMDQDYIRGLYVGLGGKQQGVDFPLWTIISEISCYILTGILGAIGVGKKHRVWFLAVTMLLMVGFLYLRYKHGFDPNENPSRIPHLISYLLGVSAYYYHEKIPLNGIAALICAVLASVVSNHAWAVVLFPVLFGYVVIYLGFKISIKNIERKADLSYGVYMYGWPMQLLLPMFGAAQWGLWPYTLLTFLAVYPVAAVSWFLVEKPSLKLKRRFTLSPSDEKHVPA